MCIRHVVEVDTCIPISQVVPMKGLLELLEREKYTDVTFLVEDQSFKAHRVIVASQSEYFDRFVMPHQQQL